MLSLIFQDLGLVILCSSENEERAYMVAALEEFKGPGIPRYHQPEELRRYLATQFLVPHQRAGLYQDWTAAAEVGRAEKYGFLAFVLFFLFACKIRVLLTTDYLSFVTSRIFCS